MIGTLEANDKESIINDHSIVGSASYNLAKEFKSLCDEKEESMVLRDITSTRRETTNINLKKMLSLTR